METQRIDQDSETGSDQLATQHLQSGTTLQDRYLIQTEIGEGGMGAVYRARDMHFPNVIKLVAVKEMINQARDPLLRNTIVSNFEREANLLATLDHPSIPRIYDYFSHNNRSYLVLEYINGKDLERIINETEGFIPEERIIHWGVELCDVLSYLHNHKPEPIIFRDMKPSNVMINQYGHVTLIDFGIAKPFETGQKGTMIGTEGYSPPEQYRGEASHLADIYALGATFHHLLSKQDPRLEPPFTFGERPIRQYNHNVSPEIEEVIYKALNYSFEDRYQSAQELKEGLLKAAKVTGHLPHISKSSTPSRRESQDVKPLWKFATEDEIRGTPAYKQGMILIGSYDHNLYALDAKTGDFFWKYPTDGGVVSAPAVHDGNVYFGSEDHRLHVITSRSGQINWTYYTDGPVRSSPHIAEGHVFIGSDDGCLHAVNHLSGRSSWKLDTGSMVRSTPLVADEYVYFGTESGDFFCVDFTSKIKWRFSAKRAITSSPVVANGVVYFGSMDSTLYALDAKSGWVIWRYRLGKPTISTPHIADEAIFTGAVDGKLYCIDAKSAREVWQFDTDHQVTGSPIVYNESVYCGSVDGNFYCLEHTTGRLRWKFRTDGPITGTPLAVDDTIYIGSTDHNIYALMA